MCSRVHVVAASLCRGVPRYPSQQHGDIASWLHRFNIDEKKDEDSEIDLAGA